MGIKPHLAGWAHPLRPLRPIILLYHTPRILSIENVKKIAQNNYPEIVHYSILQSASGCGIIIMSRGSERPRVRLADWVRVTEKKL